MKFTLDRPLALKVLGKALETCNVKNKDRIESEICFKLENNTLRVYSMDDFAEQHLILPATDLSGEEGESFSSFGPSLVDFFKAFTPSSGSEEVVCTYMADKKVLALNSIDKKTKMVLTTREGQFIPMRFVAKSAPVTIDGYRLAQALSNTAYAAHTNPGYSPQTAVKVSFDGTSVRAVATDAHRIASFETQTESNPVAKPFNFLLPRSVAECLSSLLNSVADVKVTLGESHVRFEAGDELFQAGVEPERDTPFPELDKYLKADEVAYAIVDKTQLIQALKRAALIAKDSSIKITISASKNEVLINSKENDRGLSEDAISVQKIEIKDGETEKAQRVSFKYFQKAVETLAEEYLEISFLECEGVGLLVVVHDASNTNQHLLFGALGNEETVD